MKVLGVGSITTAVIEMVIGDMRSDSGGMMLIEVPEGRPSFWIFVPKSVAKKLAVGNRITAICAPSKKLEFASEVFALKVHHDNQSSEVIFDRDNYARDFI